MSFTYQFIIEGVDNASNTFRNVGQAAEQTNASFKNLVVGVSGLATSAFNLYLNFDRIQKSQVMLDRSNLMVQRSTEALDQAQKNLNEAIQKYGGLSPEAKDATDKLKITQEALSVATDRADLAQNNLNNTIASFALSIAPTAITMIASGSGLIKTFQALRLELEMSKAAAVGLSLAVAAIPFTAAVILPQVRDFALNLRRNLGMPTVGPTGLLSPLSPEQEAAATTPGGGANWNTGGGLNEYLNFIQTSTVATSDFQDQLAKLAAIVEKAAGRKPNEKALDMLTNTSKVVTEVVDKIDKAQSEGQSVFDNLLYRFNIEQARKAGEDFVEAYAKSWESGQMLRVFGVAARFATAMKIDLKDAINILDELMNKIKAPVAEAGYDWRNLGNTGPVFGLGPQQIMPDWMIQEQTTLVAVTIQGPVVNIQGDASRQTAAMAAAMVTDTLKNITLTASSSAADATHKQVQVNNTVVTNAGGGAVIGGANASFRPLHRERFSEGGY